MKKTFLFVAVILSIYMVSCSELQPAEPDPTSLLDGPIEGLTPEENQRFIRGDLAFNDEIFHSTNGLGPVFVASSCGSCHPGDGKGHPFTTLTRFGQADSSGNPWIGKGGPQLQNRAIPSFKPEILPEGVPFTRLTPPANTGLGLLSAIPDAELLKFSDPDDLNGDGISGRPNWIKLPGYESGEQHVSNQGKYIGRFGKKAAVFSLLQQTVNAYNQDIGVTSALEPVDPYSGKISEPEVDMNTINDVVFYLETLRAPVPRNPNDTKVKTGKALFMAGRCSGCHIPEIKTGPHSISALANQVIYPYTDLLLHDMGPGLNDGYTEGSALPSEWRTPPLWGLGLSKNSQGGSYFLLHDGRAHSIESAILWHDGEAQYSKQWYQGLSENEKSALLAFLESL